MYLQMFMICRKIKPFYDRPTFTQGVSITDNPKYVIFSTNLALSAMGNWSTLWNSAGYTLLNRTLPYHTLIYRILGAGVQRLVGPKLDIQSKDYPILIQYLPSNYPSPSFWTSNPKTIQYSSKIYLKLMQNSSKSNIFPVWVQKWSNCANKIRLHFELRYMFQPH